MRKNSLNSVIFSPCIGALFSIASNVTALGGNRNNTFSNGAMALTYQWSKSSVGWTTLGENRSYNNFR